MGLFYEKIRTFYVLHSPLGREQVKTERMVAECIDMLRRTNILLQHVEESATQLESSVDNNGHKIDCGNEYCKKSLEAIQTFMQSCDSTKETIIENTKIIHECREDINRCFMNVMKERFTGHYELWRLRRINCIVNHYGEDWFKGKKILELGAGYGDIGYFFSTLGADVTFVEGRRENCDVIRKRYPNNKVYEMNCENEWSFCESIHFDLVLHMGLLYHLDNFLFALDHCLKCADKLVLETEVCDSDDENYFLKTQENTEWGDQSLIGIGTRPSAEYIEKHLREMEWAYERVNDTSCNASFHKYNWKVKNTKNWDHGMRRFWFCCKV